MPAGANLRGVALLADVALSRTLTLLVIFLGIGVLVNILIVIIAIGVIGEHRQNVSRRTERQ
jgi:hypothetical protein